jgi:triphosphoribosyl-dephospho-CoA synthase
VTAQDAIAAAFVVACCDELGAPKPGNVHVFAPGRKPVDLFRRSAEACARPLTLVQARVGTRILGAVEASISETGTNTNLGIVLLCAPLAAAAELGVRDIRAAVSQVLDALDVEDAALAFRAIVGAAPGGLGRAERHDVRAPPSITLREAMAAAADRDLIARQYVSGFKDIFAIGEPALAAAIERWGEQKWAALAVFLEFMSAFDDSHVVREHGSAVAREVRRAGKSFNERLARQRDPAQSVPELLDWDRSLKDRSINPGTSADLTVATLFVRRLRNILP